MGREDRHGQHRPGDEARDGFWERRDERPFGRDYDDLGTPWRAGGHRDFPSAGGIGPYSGRGPRGYRRSDARLLEDINQALEDHPHVDASDIEVTCADGEITLKGAVSDRRARRIAEACVDGISGVKDVRNELRVNGDRKLAQ